MAKDKRKAYIALALVSFFWGTTYLAAKISASHIPGLFVAAVRQVVSGALLAGYFMAMGYKWPDRSSWIKILIQAVLLLCIAQGLSIWALEYIESGLAAILAGMVPLLVALFSILLLRFSRFTPLLIIGLLVGFGGIVVIFYKYFEGLTDSKYTLGVGLSLIAVVCWSLGTVFAARYKPKTEIMFSVGLQMLLAGILLLIICAVSGKYVNLAETNTNALWGLAYLIVIGSLLTYSAYVFAVSKLPPTQVSIYAYINPIVAIFLGWLVLHEQMGINVITGTAITLGGVYLVNREFKKQGPPQSPKGETGKFTKPA